MKRLILLFAALGTAMAIVGLAFSGDGLLKENQQVEAQTTERPNFVFILTDDMRKDDLKYMPKTRALVGAQGMRFENAFVSNSVCCPSRATIMRGQYAHNTGVWSNTNGPNGGWQGYVNHGHEQDNIATRFHDAGYRTGLFGKYFNAYEGTTVPPGWDDWFALLPGGDFYNFYVNDNGTRKYFAKSDNTYITDVQSRETQSFIDDSVVASKPFFAYVAPKSLTNRPSQPRATPTSSTARRPHACPPSTSAT